MAEEKDFTKKTTKKTFTPKKPSSRRRRGSSQKDNFQDKFADKEFKKGVKFAIETGSSKDNDPSWYSNNPYLLKDTCSIPFNYPSGYQWPNLCNTDRIKTSVNTGFVNSTISVPGIMKLTICPAIGDAESPIDAINVANAGMFNFIRSKTSGSQIWESPDMGLYLIAMDSAYSFYSWLTRLYGVMSNFSVMDRYTPVTLVESMGASYSDLQSKLSDFRAMINQYAARLASFCVPKDITYTTRHIWMYEGLYKDADTTKAQIYYYNPGWFFKYNEASGTAGVTATCTLIPFANSSNTLMTLSDLAEFGDTLLDPLFQSQDIGYISAAILRAFEAGNLFKVAPISETYVITPSYSAEVLSQIENAYIFNGGNYKCTVTENKEIDNSYLSARLTFEPQSAPSRYTTNAGVPVDILFAENPAYMNFHSQDVSAEDVMVASRLMAPSIISVGDGKTYYFSGIGSEIVTSMEIVYEPDMGLGYSAYDLPSIVQVQFQDQDSSGSGVNPLIGGTANYLIALSLLPSFDWHPRCRVVYYWGGASSSTATSSVVTIGQPMCDIDNFTFLTKEQLATINKIAMLSMFSCTNMGQYNIGM